MRRILAICLALLLLTFSGTALAAADFDRDVIEVEGYGAPPATASSPAQSRALARMAAKADAYRNLLTEIQGVQVDAHTEVKDLLVANDSINLKVQGVVKGAVVTEESSDEDGGYRVKLQLRLHGTAQSLASAVLQPWKKEAFPARIAEPGAPAAAVQPTGGYTGVIIDCRGLELRPVMSPVIRSAGGSPVYGYQNLDSTKVIRDGMAAYSHGDQNLLRAGSQPLVLRAAAVQDGCNPVLGAADAARLLAENQSTHFLDAAAVVFERD